MRTQWQWDWFYVDGIRTNNVTAETADAAFKMVIACDQCRDLVETYGVREDMAKSAVTGVDILTLTGAGFRLRLIKIGSVRMNATFRGVLFNSAQGFEKIS